MNEDGLWFQARRVWKNTHIRSIFLQSLRKHSVASFRATVLIPHLPRRHSCEGRKRLRLRATVTKPWALARKITVTDSGEKGRCQAASSASSCSPLPPYSETRDHPPHTGPQTRYGNPPAGGGREIQEKSWAEIEWFRDMLKVERKAAAGKRTRGNSNGRCGPDEVPVLMIYQDNQKSRTGDWRALNSCLASLAD